MLKHAPAFIIWNSKEIALERELKVYTDGFNDLMWIINLRAIIIMINESRLFQIVYNAIVLTLSFIFLFYTSKLKTILIACLCLLFPFIFPHCLMIIIYFGKSIGLKDNDIKSFWLVLTCRQSCSSVKDEIVDDDKQSKEYKIASPDDDEDRDEPGSCLWLY